MSRPYLTPRRVRRAKEVIANIIIDHGITAEVFRPTLDGADTFYGPHESAVALVGEIPIEPRKIKPKALEELGCDLVVGTLPDADVHEGDLIDVDDDQGVSVRYRVSNSESFNAFGMTTHKDLHLERLHRDQPAEGVAP